MARRLGRVALVAIALAIVASAVPWAIRGWWEVRSANPVRRGLLRAQEMGCFTCHGPTGVEGLPDPNIVGRRIPGWTRHPGGVAEGEDPPGPERFADEIGDIRRTIRFGTGEEEGLAMPAYEDRLRRGDLDDLTAAVVVLAGGWVPPADAPARRGLALARRWGCGQCHNAGGAGGLPNPGSFTGFIPGWYGRDFEDLVHSRQEFDAWVREGGIERLRQHPIASRFLRRQALNMPEYPQLGAQQLDDLWAYTRWLSATDGGWRPAGSE